MNQKQMKLLRYFVKETNNVSLVATVEKAWPNLTHKQRGQISTWLKTRVVTLMAERDAQKHYKMRQEAIQAAQNLEVLKGFVSA